jgi:hypothetical protein
MAKYVTKYFGEIEINENYAEAILEAKIELNGKAKEVSVLFVSPNTYFQKIDVCVKILDDYPSVHKIGTDIIIKNYKHNKEMKLFINKCFNKYGTEAKEEIFGTKEIEKISIKYILGQIGPPNILIYKDTEEDEIKIALGYQLHKDLDEAIIVEIDEKYKLKGVKYYIL